MGRLIDVSDDRFWQILFDEACVEGQQADRINDELEDIIAYDVEAVVKQIQDIGTRFCVSVHCNNECENCDHGSIMKAIIEIVRNGGVK